MAVNEFEEKLSSRLHQARTAVPAKLDASILEDAHSQLALQRPHRRHWLRPVSALPLAAAAAAAILALVFWPGSTKQSPDIVDAYRLAIRIEQGDSLSLEFDYDGNGKVDKNDVSAIITETVAVPRRAS